ncbi:MAG TPA: hypothetical protein VFN38_18125, partial [Gemmatimonadaceae bacterium]|nr:hypothetical protein [Gemmatimonadaceae bacterium]
APVKQQTSLAGKPTVLFLLFGDHNDPRILPVATIGHGRISPISLDAEGWRKFDALYFKKGAEMAVYRRGAALGNAVVRRGMWDGDEPLYKLPGCRALRPLAAATLAAAPPDVVTLELIGTSDALPAAPSRADVGPAMTDSAREVSARVAGREGLSATDRADLELTVSAFNTGATGRPTLVGSYSERGGGGGASARHVFVLADSTAKGYDATFVHTAKDSVPEFRRLIDHVDLTGDGVDEIVLEGWRAGGDTYLVVMKYDAGRWHEVARGDNTWCADPPRK